MVRLTYSQAVEFIMFPLDDDVTVCVVFYFSRTAKLLVDTK